MQRDRLDHFFLPTGIDSTDSRQTLFKDSIKIWSLHTLYKFGHYGLKIYS